jgi:GINS complex subunit 4
VPATGSESSTERARGLIYQMELDRIKFSLTSYLRCRLRKIERHARFVLNTPELHTRLSPAELTYLEQYLQITDKALHAMLLSRLPEHLRGLSEPDMRDEPDLDQYVFALLQDSAAVQDNQERLELTLGDLVVIKYRTVQELVLQRRAILM